MFRSHPVLEQPAAVALGGKPRILVIKLASLGDLLLTTPALRALRLRYPAARIDVLTTEGSAPLLRDSPPVDSIFTLNKYAFDRPLAVGGRVEAVGEALALGRRLRGRRYDAALLAHHLTLPYGRLKFRALIEAIRARCAVGLDNGRGGYLDVRVPDFGFGWRHEAEYALALAEAVGASLPSEEQGLRVADLGWAACVSAPMLAPPLVALHPGGGSYSVARRWPAERWAELAGALHGDHGATVTLLSGSDEGTLVDGIVERLSAPAWLTTTDTASGPQALAAALSRCALLVANDSFPMHLATAVGTPVVAVFGPSNARAWGPYAPDRPEIAAVVRRTDLPCSPCFYRGHALGTPQGCAERPCLTELPLQPVREAVWCLLAGRESASAGRGD